MHSDDGGYRGCRRGDLVSLPRRGLGTVGQVGRSRNAQTADKRASGDYVTLRGRKSALLLLSLLPPTPPPPLSRSPSSPPPSPLLPRTFTNDRLPHLSYGLFTNKSSHLSKRLLRSYTRVWVAASPGSTWPNGGMVDRSVESSNVAAAGGTHRADCIAQNCREPESVGQRKRLNASLRNCPTPPARHFRRPTVSNSIPFHFTLHTSSSPHILRHRHFS